VMFLSFALPSQRSGRYLMAAMPAVALLCAFNWQQINRKVFIASLVLAGAVIAALAYLALRLQAEIAGLYTPMFWVLLAGTAVLLVLAIVVPDFTRPAVNHVALLVLLCFAALLRPFDGALGNYSAEALHYARGKEVAVPCNFRAMDEGHRFILPGAEIHGYSEDQNLAANELANRYPLFAVRLPLNDSTQNGGCAECKIIGQRLDIRGRQSSAELKEIFLEGNVCLYLFVKEVLMESPPGKKVTYEQTLAQMCR
jgi:hypothetical protein